MKLAGTRQFDAKLLKLFTGNIRTTLVQKGTLPLY